jgi:hypothetical protein
VSGRRDWPIVVGGCHRSGTSLVRRVLDAHPRIHCGPEIPFFRDFHGDYAADTYAHLRYSRAARDLVSDNAALGVLGRSFLELHEHARAEAGKDRWADKAPENVLYVADWDRLLDGRFFLVHVVRNPLDTIASMEGRFPLTLPSSLEGRIDHYLRYTEAGEAAVEARPERSLVVVYESLSASPEEELGRLMGGLEEEPHAHQLAFNDVPHASGLEDPNVAETTAIHDRSVGAWRAILDEDAARHVWERTQDAWGQIERAHDGVQTLVRGVLDFGGSALQ